MDNILGKIDHTALKADTEKEQIEKLCKEAIDHGFAAVCVNPYYVSYCKKTLKNTDIKVATVIGFPLGASTKEAKAFETKDAINNGADEVDMVINIAALKNGNYKEVKEDISAVVDKAKDKALVKVIIETCLLSKDEKVKACELAKEAGADFVKTSTGFSKAGASVEDVRLMRDTVGREMGVKASGGVRDLKTAKEMIEAGATRIGASSGVEIAKELKNNKI